MISANAKRHSSLITHHSALSTQHSSLSTQHPHSALRIMATNPLSDDSGKHDLERIEIKLLTEGIYRHCGFDFRDYSMPSLRRRIWKRIYAEGLTTISGLTEKILHDSQSMEPLLLH